MHLFEMVLAAALGCAIVAASFGFVHEAQEKRNLQAGAESYRQFARCVRNFTYEHRNTLFKGKNAYDFSWKNVPEGFERYVRVDFPYSVRFLRQAFGEKSDVPCYLILFEKEESLRVRSFLANSMRGATYENGFEACGLVHSGFLRARGSEYDLSAFGHIVDGTLAVFGTFFEDGLVETNALFRTKIPDRPEVNQMETNLDMSGNAIQNLGSVSFVKSSGFVCSADTFGKLIFDGTLRLCTKIGESFRFVAIEDSRSGHIVDTYTVASGTRIAKPNCTSGKPALIATAQAPARSTEIEDIGDSWFLKAVDGNGMNVLAQIYGITLCQ